MKESKKKKTATKKSNNYFGTEVEQAIKKFLTEESQSKREILFTKTIYPAFYKMLAMLVNKYKVCPNNITDITAKEIVNEGVAHLYTNVLSAVNFDKGKAYSYCTKSAINFCLAKRAKLYSQRIQRAELDEVDDNRDIMSEYSLQNQRDELSIFIDLWTNWYDANLETLYTQDKDIKIASAIVEIFRSRKFLEDFKKKKIYTLIREICGYSTNEITPVLRIVEVHFFTMYNNYKNTEKLIL